MSFVFVDPPSPPGFVAFRHHHGGYGECCKTSRLKVPTLDVFHCASLLLEKGFEASVVDSALMDHTPKECVEAILAGKPSLVAFRVASGSCSRDLAVARELRSRFAGPVVFFGPHAGEHPFPGETIPGEAPEAFLEIARKGLSGRRRAAAPRIKDLDALPIPRWDLVDYRRYSYVTAQTSWGCPFRCGYCPYPVTQGAQWRVRSAASVVREFAALRDRYGLRFVLLRDPEFSLEKKRTAELCRALSQAGTPLMWGCETRLDTLDEELVELMSRAGCVRVAFGVDSVNPGTLRDMGRRDRGMEFVRRQVGLLKRHGMLTYGMYMIGLPGETEESSRRLVDFALELDTNAASFSMATPFAGTALARRRSFIEAGEPLHLTSCVPSMGNEAMGSGTIERLYLDAKERWKRRKQERPAFALSGLP